MFRKRFIVDFETVPYPSPDVPGPPPVVIVETPSGVDRLYGALRRLSIKPPGKKVAHVRSRDDIS